MSTTKYFTIHDQCDIQKATDFLYHEDTYNQNKITDNYYQKKFDKIF